MPRKKNFSDRSYILDKISKYRDNSTKNEKAIMDELHEKYDSKDPSIPPLSQSEIEHLTYLRVLDEYNTAKQKRTSYRKYGAWTIIILGILFLTLIFSLEAKIEFLVLWVASIFYCVAVMIRAEYRYHMFKEFLGIADEFDYYEIQEDDDENENEEDVVMVVLPVDNNKNAAEASPARKQQDAAAEASPARKQQDAAAEASPARKQQDTAGASSEGKASVQKTDVSITTEQKTPEKIQPGTGSGYKPKHYRKGG